MEMDKTTAEDEVPKEGSNIPASLEHTTEDQLLKRNFIIHS